MCCCCRGNCCCPGNTGECLVHNLQHWQRKRLHARGVHAPAHTDKGKASAAVSDRLLRHPFCCVQLPLVAGRRGSSQSLRRLAHPGFPAARLCSLQPAKNKGHGCRVSGVRVCTVTVLGGAAAATNTHRHDVTSAQDQWHCLHLHWSGQPAERSSITTAICIHQSTMQRLAGCRVVRAPLLPLCCCFCYTVHTHVQPSSSTALMSSGITPSSSKAAAMLFFNADHSCQISFDRQHKSTTDGTHVVCGMKSKRWGLAMRPMSSPLCYPLAWTLSGPTAKSTPNLLFLSTMRSSRCWHRATRPGSCWSRRRHVSRSRGWRVRSSRQCTNQPVSFPYSAAKHTITQATTTLLNEMHVHAAPRDQPLACAGLPCCRTTSPPTSSCVLAAPQGSTAPAARHKHGGQPLTGWLSKPRAAAPARCALCLLNCRTWKQST